MKRPTHCPYCSEPVEKMRPYEAHAPPDERDNYPPAVGVEDEAATPEPVTWDTVRCERMHPCGHLFRKSDMRAWDAGDVKDSELGERVVNPKSTVE